MNESENHPTQTPCDATLKGRGELLPVRMLNEYAYCPRLFHLMHVEGRWADNHYTIERRHFLITYDVSDDKRRTRLFQLLQGEGDHAQFSVFFCDLTRAELASLRARTTEIINQHEDQILILDLGLAERSLDQNLEVLGKPYAPLARVLVV